VQDKRRRVAPEREMITEDQSSVVTFLSSPLAHAGAAVERIDTHASILFLAGERAWKLKRAVRYDYLDYSTADRRRAMCEAEVRVNRRTAPRLYHGVTPITRQADGTLAIGGAGTPVDWLVEMSRFQQDSLFDRLAEAGKLSLSLMRRLAQTIARFHVLADDRPDQGGWDGMARIVRGNAAGFLADGAGILDPVKCASLTDRARFILDRCGPLADRRRDGGFVRHCHGDLHLRNIVLIDGHATLFDAIEFNDEIACIDVLYDLAFLLMDLWRRGLRQQANTLWNAYLAETADFDGFPLMPLFLSCRAAIVAKTTATAANLEADGERRQRLQAHARTHLALATILLAPPTPCLIAVGGASGSGKSTVAIDLAPSIGAAPGAVVIRSDEIRKKLCGVKPLERLGPEGYTAEVSQRVYRELAQQANAVLRGGCAAVVDAVFAEPGQREAVRHVAAAAGVPFIGLWLDAPESVLITRVQQRGPDVSDADSEVVRRQLAQGAEPSRWHRLDASGTPQQVCEVALRILPR
jgi:aminoglycoside phosphotransferase family enzyme/predicted kinase